MCRFERYTASRGRSGLPETFFLTRRCRRSRATLLASTRMLRGSLRGLAGLLPDVLPLVPDTLALVRLGLADLADVRRDLPNQLLVDPPDHDPVRSGHLELDALGGVERHGVGEPHGKLEVGSLQQGPVPDAHDLEPLLVALG